MCVSCIPLLTFSRRRNRRRGKKKERRGSSVLRTVQYCAASALGPRGKVELKEASPSCRGRLRFCVVQDSNPILTPPPPPPPNRRPFCLLMATKRAGLPRKGTKIALSRLIHKQALLRDKPSQHLLTLWSSIQFRCVAYSFCHTVSYVHNYAIYAYTGIRASFASARPPACLRVSCSLERSRPDAWRQRLKE